VRQKRNSALPRSLAAFLRRLLLGAYLGTRHGRRADELGEYSIKLAFGIAFGMVQKAAQNSLRVLAAYLVSSAGSLRYPLKE
jgi:hypothetical protein